MTENDSIKSSFMVSKIEKRFSRSSVERDRSGVLEFERLESVGTLSVSGENSKRWLEKRLGCFLLWI